MRLIGHNDFERNYNEWIVQQEIGRIRARNASRFAAVLWGICGIGIEYAFDCNGWALGIGFVAAVICFIAGIFDANMPHHFDDHQNH